MSAAKNGARAIDPHASEIARLVELAEPAAPDADVLLDERAGADFLTSKPATLKSWRKKGIGPRYLRIGGRAIRYRLSDLRAYLAQVTIEPAKGDRA